MLTWVTWAINTWISDVVFSAAYSLLNVSLGVTLKFTWILLKHLHSGGLNKGGPHRFTFARLVIRERNYLGRIRRCDLVRGCITGGAL